MARQLRSGVRMPVLLAAWLFPASLVAQDTLPWNLSQYPDGGPRMTEAVATALGRNSGLIDRMCRDLAKGTPRQAASGFSGIALAAYAAPPEISDAIIERFPDCCDRIVGDDVDGAITLGSAVALEGRAWGETDIGLGRQIEQLVGMCGDGAFTRSYELARGEDDLGLLIARGGGGDPVATGSITTSRTPGGGLASQN